MINHSMISASSSPCGEIKGSCKVPGDKSISHRALMLTSLCVGRSKIVGISRGDDVVRTKEAMKSLGANIVEDESGDNILLVDGVGLGGLQEPNNIIDMGNSGTGARLLTGMLSTHRLNAFVTGDESLRSRPMARITDPLSFGGAQFYGREGMYLPMLIVGNDEGLPINYTLPVASAQIKSAILMAGLNVAGTTIVVEPVKTRAHTENMLNYFGVKVNVSENDAGARVIEMAGLQDLSPRELEVPGDPSAAAFPIVAALITPGSELEIKNVMVDSFRAAFIDVLQKMGGDITLNNQRAVCGEQVADILVKHSELTAVDIPSELASSLIDEYPILSIAAAFANGKTVMRGIGELRVKECDRLEAIAAGLTINGITVESGDDWLIIHGDSASAPLGGGLVCTHFDHRIAMAFLIMGFGTQKPVQIDDYQAAQTSFTGFAETMNTIGAEIIVDNCE